MMKNTILFSLLFCINQCFGLAWNELIDQYETLLPNNSILQEQYAAFTSSRAPIIADPRVKEIPIHENNEKLIDLKLVL